MRRLLVVALALAALVPALAALASGQGHPISATAGQPFSGRVATAFYCDGCAPTAATIDWGDGTSSAGTLTDVGPPGASNYDVTGAHTWAAAGTYDVKVTLSRPSPPGNEDVPTTATVTAAPPGPPAPSPPAPAPGAPAAPLSAAFEPAAPSAAHRAVQFAPSSAATAGAGNALTYSWDFDGDLGSDWACPGSAPLASHTFSTPGAKTVTLTVTDEIGRKAVATETVTAPRPRRTRLRRSRAR
jgi:PKD repeat protein